jgi:uncharacterized membrane protein YkoI
MPALAYVILLAAATFVAGVQLSAATYEDYEHAREAVDRGEILPLTEILKRVEARHGGRMIEVEFEVEDAGYLYELELIQPDGRIIEVMVDAVSGETLSFRVDTD